MSIATDGSAPTTAARSRSSAAGAAPLSSRPMRRTTTTSPSLSWVISIKIFLDRRDNRPWTIDLRAGLHEAAFPGNSAWLAARREVGGGMAEFRLDVAPDIAEIPR